LRAENSSGGLPSMFDAVPDIGVLVIPGPVLRTVPE